MSERYQSWGRLPRATALPHARAHVITARTAPLPIDPDTNETYLPYGNGRSYGDSCLNAGGTILDTRGLSRILAFDPETGIIALEAGTLLSVVLAFAVPRGFFLPVTPGTKFVTVGGAIANDVHGKNHHVRGTFGSHVIDFELARSDGTQRTCSPRHNSHLFRATIGGMGLTGVITQARIRLMRIPGASIEQTVTPFSSLDAFVALAVERDRTHEYAVAWIDSAARGKQLGRGLFLAGRHLPDAPNSKQIVSSTPRLGVPFTPPLPLINNLNVRAFNALYRWRTGATTTPHRVAYEPFFYPLDGVRDWNRLYGPGGLVQHQSVIPLTAGIAPIRELLTASHRASMTSFLTVLKLFGTVSSPGLLSFPRAGLTLTLDFPNIGVRTTALLAELDKITMAAGGAVNPYKDARMSPATFQASFPQWRDLAKAADPRASSSFWRRVSTQ